MNEEVKLSLEADKQLRFECVNLVVTTFVVEQSIDQVIEAAMKIEHYVNDG
jgi:hypothetical protein